MVSALRLTIASLIVLSFAALSGHRKKLKYKHELLLALCGMALAAHFASWMIALCHVSIASATLLLSTSPLWTGLYDSIILKRKTTTIFWFGMAVSAVGTIIFVCGIPSIVKIETTNGAFFGEIIAAFGAIVFAFYLIAIRSVTHQYSTLTIITRTYSWAAIFLWIAAIAVQEKIPGTDIESWSGIVATAIITQLLGHTFLNASLKTFPSNTVALTTLLEPVCAAILASIVFQETLSAQMILGAVTLLAGLALVMAEGQSKKVAVENLCDEAPPKTLTGANGLGQALELKK